MEISGNDERTFEKTLIKLFRFFFMCGKKYNENQEGWTQLSLGEISGVTMT